MYYIRDLQKSLEIEIDIESQVKQIQNLIKMNNAEPVTITIVIKEQETSKF